MNKSLFVILYIINLFISFKYIVPFNINLMNNLQWKNSYNFFLVLIYIIPSILYFFNDIDTSSYNILNIVLCIGIIYIGADLVSSILHYIGDNIRIGEINNTFISHHDDPAEMIEYTNMNCLVKGTSAFFLSSILYYLYVKDTKRNIFSDTRVIMFIYLFFFELIHKFSHCRNHNVELPYMVEKFQDMGLFLHPSNHKEHHKTNNSDYSLLNGSSNKLFNLFLPMIDFVIDKLKVRI